MCRRPPMCGSGPAARCDLHGRVLPTLKEIMTGRTRQQQGRQQRSFVVIWVLRVKDFNMCKREKPFAPIHLSFPLAIYIHPCDFHNVTNLEEQKRQNLASLCKQESLHYITNTIYPKTNFFSSVFEPENQVLQRHKIPPAYPGHLSGGKHS